MLQCAGTAVTPTCSTKYIVLAMDHVSVGKGSSSDNERLTTTCIMAVSRGLLTNIGAYSPVEENEQGNKTRTEDQRPSLRTERQRLLAAYMSHMSPLVM